MATEIVDFPINSMVIFQFAMLNYQRVPSPSHLPQEVIGDKDLMRPGIDSAYLHSASSRKEVLRTKKKRVVFSKGIWPGNETYIYIMYIYIILYNTYIYIHPFTNGFSYSTPVDPGHRGSGIDLEKPKIFDHLEALEPSTYRLGPACCLPKQWSKSSRHWLKNWAKTPFRPLLDHFYLLFDGWRVSPPGSWFKYQPTMPENCTGPFSRRSLVYVFNHGHWPAETTQDFLKSTYWTYITNKTKLLCYRWMANYPYPSLVLTLQQSNMPGWEILISGKANMFFWDVKMMHPFLLWPCQNDEESVGTPFFGKPI